MDILIKWTPGHVGIKGNEKADEEAKKAAREGLSPSNRLLAPLRKALPRSKSAGQQEFIHKLKIKALELWKKSSRYNRMERIDLNHKINNFAKLTSNLHCDRASLLLLFRLRAGHVPLNAYLHKIQKTDSPICPSCQQNSKTVIHYILHCKTFKEARKTLFQKAGRDVRNLGLLLSMADLLPHLFQFIRNTSHLRLHDRDTII